MVQQHHYSLRERNKFLRRCQGQKDDTRADQFPSCPVTPLGNCHMCATCDGVVTMGDVINFKRVKKRVEREQAAKQAEANRVRFGRTKAERALEQRRAERANELLDQHRTDGKDAS